MSLFRKVNFFIVNGIITCSVFLPPFSVAAQNTTADVSEKLAAVGTSKIWGKIDNVAIEGMVEGPATENTPLQIACVFAYTEGDIVNSPPALPAAVNGLVHLDKSLNGIITDIRKSGKFSGHAFETLLITPPAGAIAPKKLLLIGLGNRNNFTPDIMITVGIVALREAMRLGISSYSIASDLKDAGIDSPTALVAENLVKGTFEAYDTQEYLTAKGMTDFTSITRVTLLAGPAFFKVAGEGIQKAIDYFNKR